jgi:hypothetical protein
MALVHSPSIVTNGLVLYLDAANPKSYPGTGTGWSDLSGLGNNGTLINGVTYSNANLGTFTFDGVDDYMTTPLSTAFQDFTVCVWFRQSGGAIAFQRLVDKSYINGFWIGRSSTNANTWGGGIKETGSPFGRFITLTDGQWHYLAYRRQGTTHTIFGDGITNTTSGTVTGTALDTTQMQIGLAVADSATVFNGNIPVVKVYNRALQDSEILQNFNALRGRFGI